ncbi:MAG TPA: MlaD family protein [Acidimicrobiales bacterium]|nr:MlaD family protein [Acidimicrobiales bacterium]
MLVKKFRERNLRMVAAVALAIFLVAVLIALNISNLPLISNQKTYQADFASAVGLQKGDVVTISGVRVGAVTALALEGNVVRVTFKVNGYSLGDQTRVDEKILNPVGVEYLELRPAGAAPLQGPVPVTRTTVAATFVSNINDLTAETRQTNINQLVKSFNTFSQILQGTSPAQTRAALEGISKLSGILASRQSELSGLVTQANALVVTLNDHSAQLVNLLGQADLVLQVLNQRRSAITNLLTTTTELSQELNHIIVGDRPQLETLLTNLQTVSSFLAKDANNFAAAQPLLAAFSRYSANIAGSGPFADFVAPALFLPDNLIAQCSKLQPLDPQRGCRV